MDGTSSIPVLGTIEKLFARRYARAWVCGVWTYNVKVIEF